MSEKSLSKKFSIGLNLTPDENDNRKLLEDYHQYLSSLYFSFPMGMQYYSRLGIKDEFQDEDSAQRLFNVLTYAKELGVRRELALNTYHLSDLDIDYAIEFTKKFGIIPEEIVCLKEYGEKIRKAFPNCELKYSFNNTDYQDIPKCFDTVVVGKRYLRSKEMRHQLLESGYNLVLLLNNGCSFTCPGPCRNGTECRKIVAQQLLTSTPSELYALESFFPEELTRLLETDSCSDQYRFKLNTRPLGLMYTRRVLEAYLGHFSSDELIEASPQSYGLFGAAASLFSLAKQFDFQEIKKIKSELPV